MAVTVSARVARRMLTELREIADPRVGEVEGGRRAGRFADWYAQADESERRECWLLMSEQFALDPGTFDVTPVEGASEAGAAVTAEIRFRSALQTPRRRLLQRFAGFPGGMAFLVSLRAELLPHVEEESRLAALDLELEHLFSTWFDVAFLELRRLSWDSPASMIEKLIRYEAVHDIRSWGDAKNRLDRDRRCYGFFHPSMPDEPLIFVEVALMNSMASAIEPLLDESAVVGDPAKATSAVFYSISNCQTGLRGVGFGDSLIKRVVETIQRELPKVETFATLSPIPGLRRWVTRNAEQIVADIDPKMASDLSAEAGIESELAPDDLLAAFDRPLEDMADDGAWQELLMQCAARYLLLTTADGKPVDAVARFHLGNGARVERINWAGDRSPKGLKQSFGIMVNYLYDFKRIDKHRELLAEGRIPAARAVAALARNGRFRRASWLRLPGRLI